MKFRCERDVLADALTTASRAAASRSGALPVLSGLRLTVDGDRLHITGTDLELTIQIELGVGGDENGSTVVPAKLTTDIVKALPAGAVNVRLADEELDISAGRSQFSVRPLSLDDYPAQAEPDGDTVSLPSADVAEAIHQVVRAASNDEARAVLTGVLLRADDAVHMVATDSYRLAVRDLSQDSTGGMLQEGEEVLIPSRALSELERIIGDHETIQVRLGERDASFQVGSTKLSTRLIEGDYPNYRNLLPSSHPNVLTVSKEGLLESLRRVKILAQDTATVRLNMTSSEVELSAITTDVGNAAESVEARYEGEDMMVAFNPEYLAAGVDAITTDEITLSTTDPMKPAVLRGVGNDDYLYLLMPVRVS